MVCIGPVASHPAIYVFGVTLKLWAVVEVLGRAIGSVRLTHCPVRTLVLRVPEQAVRLMRPHMHATSGLPGGHGSGRNVVVPRRSCVVSGREIAQAVRLERPGFRSRRVGEVGGWRGNVLLDRREVQVCFGHGELSGSRGAFGSCSSQGLPVRSRNALQWCRVRMRRGEAQTY